MITLSKSQARRFLLAYQGLLLPRQGRGKPGILDYFQRVSCIQFDPLNVIGQNPHLVLQSRIGDYQPHMLKELLYQERRLLDGFDKVMSIYRVEDWPYFRRRRDGARHSMEQRRDGLEAVLPEVRAELERRGPLCSLDLNFDHRVEWPWGPTRSARAALESLYLAGELVVHHKVNTRKYYDLAQRHLPADLLSAPDPNITEADYRDWYVHRRVGSVGLVWYRGAECWLGVPADSAQRQESLERLQARGELLRASVDDITVPFYLRSQDYPLLEQILSVEAPPPQASFIAPLDNLIWNRLLTEALFNFYYRWEVYTPQAKRKYGYYVLPVLYGDRFVARVEPVFEKRTKNLLIKNWWWEAGITPNDAMLAALAECLERFAVYLDARSLQSGEDQVDIGEADRLVRSLV